MAVERKYLDYTGLQQFWAAIKAYYDEHGIDVAQNLANGIQIIFKDSREEQGEHTVLGTLVWDGSTKTQQVLLDMPAIDAENPLSYNKSTGRLSIDLSNYYTSAETDDAIAAAAARALTFKGVVAELPAVSDPSLHAGDVFIVGDKEYIFVAADEDKGIVAHFEELGFTVDLSGYYTKEEADAAFVSAISYAADKDALDAKDTELEGAISNNASAIEGLDSRLDSAETDITSLKDRVSSAEGSIQGLEDGLADEIAARAQGDEDEAAARDSAISDAFNTEIHVITYNNITGMFEEKTASSAADLKQFVEEAYRGGTVNVAESVELTDAITLEDNQNVVVNLKEGTTITKSTSTDKGAAFVLDNANAELLIVGDGEVGTTVGVWVKEGTVTIDGGEFSGSSRGLQLYDNDNAHKGEEFDSKVTVTINSGKFGEADAETGYSASQAGVVLFGGDLIINGGTFVNTWYNLTGNGTDGWNHSNITINGGEFIATGTEDDQHAAAVYWPSDGTLTINGGVFRGGCALYAKSGTVILNGGEFHGTYQANEADVSTGKASTVGGMRNYQYYGSGFYCTGDAIIFDYCCKYPGGDPKVKINKNLVITTEATGAHNVGIYYGRGVTPETASGSVDVATGLTVDTHVYDLN